MKHFSVTAAEAGERLDKYLVRKLGGAPRHGIKEMIDSGRVRVNGKRVVIAKWEMIEGDSVEVGVDGWKPGKKTGAARAGRSEAAGPPRPPARSRGFINVVYEDRDIMVVEKPPGAVIQLGEQGGGKTFVDDIREYLKRKYKSRGANVKAVHRLDKETSGLMVFAKSKAGENLVSQFKRHEIERAYLAIVDGRVKNENGKIDLPIEKGEFGFGRRAGIGRDGKGSAALTLYVVKERYKDATLLRLDLKTGRTHQARVHMAAIGHPIVGDRVYGRSGGARPGRQALHSHSLIFHHPVTGKKMQFISELPDDMKRLVDELRGE